jgi:hypothetical protein
VSSVTHPCLLLIYLLFFVVVSAAGRKSTTKCITFYSFREGCLNVDPNLRKVDVINVKHFSSISTYNMRCRQLLTIFYSIMALQPFVRPFTLFHFLNLYTVGMTPWTGDQPVAGLYLYRTIQTQHKRTQTSMLRLGFEPTIPVFERAKTVHALDRAATVIGLLMTCCVE